MGGRLDRPTISATSGLALCVHGRPPGVHPDGDRSGPCAVRTWAAGGCIQPYDWMMRRWAIRLLPVLAAVLVLLPLLREPTSDTYPLSTYPMFATDRGDIHSIATAVERTEDGYERLSPKLIAGTDEAVLASVTVKQAVRFGEADILCEEIVERLGADRRVEVRTETLDVVALSVEGSTDSAVTVHATCGGGP